MEDPMPNRLRDEFRHLDLPPNEVLGIDDEYEYMYPDLVDILDDIINETLRIIVQFNRPMANAV